VPNLVLSSKGLSTLTTSNPEISDLSPVISTSNLIPTDTRLITEDSPPAVFCNVKSLVRPSLVELLLTSGNLISPIHLVSNGLPPKS